MFKKLSRSFKLREGGECLLPQGTTHIGVKNGKIAFFRVLNSNKTSKNFRSPNSYWRYYVVPPDASAVVFQSVRHSPRGWQYGKPEFR